jgi:hypothetical protein
MSQSPPAISRSIRLRLPDGSYKTVKLPKATGVKPGAHANFFVVYNERLYVFWVERIKGGWQLLNSAGVIK